MGKRAKRGKHKEKILSQNSRGVTDQPSSNPPTSHTPSGQKSEAAGGETKRILIEVICIAVIGGALSSAFFATDHRILGIACVFLSIASGLTLLARAIAGKYSKTITWTVFGLVIVAVAIIFIFWGIDLSKPEPKNAKLPTDVTEYKLLSPEVVSNLVGVLNTPSSHVEPTAALIYAVNPDESAYSLAEQLKKIFGDGGYVIVDGTPPSDIPEIPGVSCFIFGQASANIGLLDACNAIIAATEGHRKIEMIQKQYSGALTPEGPTLDPAHPISTSQYAEHFRQVYNWQSTTSTNSVVVIMIRKK